MRFRILKHVAKDKVESFIPPQMIRPSQDMLNQPFYSMIIFPIDFQKTVVKQAELDHALKRIDGVEPLIIVAGQLTLDAQALADNLHAVTIVKRDFMPWTDAAYKDIQVDLGKHH